MSNIGETIRMLRRRRNLNLAGLATQLDISIPAISKIETGITDVNFSRLEQIAGLFDMRMVDLLALSTKEEISSDAAILRLNVQLREKETIIINLQKKVIELFEEIGNPKKLL